MCTFKNVEEIKKIWKKLKKPGRNFSKLFGNPVFILSYKSRKILKSFFAPPVRKLLYSPDLTNYISKQELKKKLQILKICNKLLVAHLKLYKIKSNCETRDH